MPVRGEAKHITRKTYHPQILQNQLRLLRSPAHVRLCRSNCANTCCAPGRMPGAGTTTVSREAAALPSWVLRSPLSPLFRPTRPLLRLPSSDPPLAIAGALKQSDPHPCFLLKSTLSLPWDLRSPPARGATFTQTSCKQEPSSPVPRTGSLPQLPRSSGKQTEVRSNVGGHSHSVTAQLSAQQAHGSGLGRGRGLECACPGVTDCN